MYLLFLTQHCIQNVCKIFVTGLLEAPTNVGIEIGVENVTISWIPPFTLTGVPIYHYTVYIISQRYTVMIDTTETHFTLEKPCTSTTYQISAWNAVGEGNTTTYGTVVCES